MQVHIALTLENNLTNVLRLDKLERETGFEPATSSLARKCSTTEPLPLNCVPYYNTFGKWAVRDSNSHGSSPTDPKSALSTNFSNRPCIKVKMSPPVDNTSATSPMSRQHSLIKLLDHFWGAVLCCLYGTLK